MTLIIKIILVLEDKIKKDNNTSYLSITNILIIKYYKSFNIV